MPAGQRRGRWSGVPLQDRQALRRDELIAAGVELLGGEGGPALTVRAVCRAAGLTERYFYESFADRDEFVRAVYDDVCARAMSTLIVVENAARRRRTVRRADGRRPDARAGCCCWRPSVEPVLTRSGAEWMPSFIELLQRKLTRITEPAQCRPWWPPA